MGGMVLETNMNEIVAQVELQNRMEKSEVRGTSQIPSRIYDLILNIIYDPIPSIIYDPTSLLSMIQPL